MKENQMIYLRVKFSITLGCFSTTCLRSSKVILPVRSFPAASNMTSVRSFRWSSPKNRELSSIHVVSMVLSSSLSILPDPKTIHNGFFLKQLSFFFNIKCAQKKSVVQYCLKLSSLSLLYGSCFNSAIYVY